MFNFFFKQKPKNTLPHWGDTKKWIEKVIQSVESSKQDKVCRSLVYKWSEQYSDVLDKKTLRNVSRDLMIQCDNKFYQMKEQELKEYKKKNKKHDK